MRIYLKDVHMHSISKVTISKFNMISFDQLWKNNERNFLYPFNCSSKCICKRYTLLFMNHVCYYIVLTALMIKS